MRNGMGLLGVLVLCAACASDEPEVGRALACDVYARDACAVVERCTMTDRPMCAENSFNSCAPARGACLTGDPWPPVTEQMLADCRAELAAWEGLGCTGDDPTPACWWADGDCL